MRNVLAVLLAVAAAVSGCATGVQRTEESDRPEERSTTAELQLHLDADAGRIARGRDAAARGDYAEALAAFDTVYRNPAADAELRAQALYQTALVQSNALNARRDLAQATASARKLLEEFPRSEWRDEAQTLLGTLERKPSP